MFAETNDELTAESEQERADEDRNSDLTMFAMGRVAAQRALRQHRKEQHDSHREHHHLGPQACATAVGDKHRPCGNEAKQFMIEYASECPAEQQQRALALSVVVGECQRAGGQKCRSDDCDGPIDLGSLTPIAREKPGVYGKTSHVSLDSRTSKYSLLRALSTELTDVK